MAYGRFQRGIDVIESNEHLVAHHWKSQLPALSGDMNYHRIVYLACGFTRDVHIALREYNLTQGFHARLGWSKHFMHLLDLNSV